MCCMYLSLIMMAKYTSTFMIVAIIIVVVIVQVGGNSRPVRVRVLDLPFTAVEWVLPSDMLQAGGDPLTPAKWMVWDRSPLAKERSLAVRLSHDRHVNGLSYLAPK